MTVRLKKKKRRGKNSHPVSGENQNQMNPGGKGASFLSRRTGESRRWGGSRQPATEVEERGLKTANTWLLLPLKDLSANPVSLRMSVTGKKK